MKNNPIRARDPHFKVLNIFGYYDLCSSVSRFYSYFLKWKNVPKSPPTMNPPKWPVKSTLFTTNIGIKFIPVISPNNKNINNLLY